MNKNVSFKTLKELGDYFRESYNSGNVDYILKSMYKENMKKEDLKKAGSFFAIGIGFNLRVENIIFSTDKLTLKKYLQENILPDQILTKKPYCLMNYKQSKGGYGSILVCQVNGRYMLCGMYKKKTF